MIAAVLLTGMMHGMSMPSLPAGGAQPPVRLLQAGDYVPRARFVGQTCAARSWQTYRGDPVVLSFIYTRCPDPTMCPLVSAKFATLQRALPNVHLVLFTLDPAYDTPRVLRRYGEEYGADPRRWTLATGNEEQMREIALEFGIGVESRVASGTVHDEALGILDSDGVVLSVVPGNSWEPDEVIAAVHDAEGVSSDPWQRLLLSVRHAARQCGLSDRTMDHAGETLLLLGSVTAIVLVTLGADAILRRRRRERLERNG